MDFGLLFRKTEIFVPFELEQVDFGILISGIPLSETSEKKCDLKVADEPKQSTN